MSQVEQKLAEMDLALPEAGAPAGSYVPTVRTGNLLFVSGQVSVDAEGTMIKGRCGETMGVEEGQAAAQRCALAILAHTKAAIGSLDKVSRIVKLNGFVNSSPAFGDHPKVINGASDLMLELFGDKGKHARAAVGVANLPFGVAVEVEAVIEVAS
ncbi:RidA family protein [Acuticoccus sp. I52.16.1]|uniref:RidA family protein n=1 Tax=Acuticoccus sp. I52.16.1 TaxID=2928472 RepID=UPI001FD3C23C|nr:RidA family protein [Acuticoccus sp. I52.16.1]UOM36114.1 RidA family protein [Acuticoccus sp. I52.16.1]